jgi:hypothetical protein
MSLLLKHIILPASAHQCNSHPPIWGLRYTEIIRTYVVPPPEVDIASGRVEDSRSFSQKIHTLCKFFVKKIKSVPCCRRRIGLQVWHQAETSVTA